MLICATSLVAREVSLVFLQIAAELLFCTLADCDLRIMLEGFRVNYLRRPILKFCDQLEERNGFRIFFLLLDLYVGSIDLSGLQDVVFLV